MSNHGGRDSEAHEVAAFASTPAMSDVPSWYPALLSTVAERIASGAHRARSAVNQQLIATYWGIGQDILDRQSFEGWGTKVIDRLAGDLKDRFPTPRASRPGI